MGLKSILRRRVIPIRPLGQSRGLTYHSRIGIFTVDEFRPKPLFWMGSSRKDLRAFPDEVQDVMGRALLDAQLEDRHPEAKPLKGF
jgi:hypothetical protein